MSRHLFQTTLVGSICNSLPCCRWLSRIAAIRLFAHVIACRSPVKCRLMSSIGTIWACPPPVAPPLMPNTGPSDGSRSARHTLLPIFAMPSARPIDVVVLPSPSAVGLIAVTKMSLPPFEETTGSIFALYLPYCSQSLTPSFAAISPIGLSSASCAIWMSLFITSSQTSIVLFYPHCAQ